MGKAFLNRHMPWVHQKSTRWLMMLSLSLLVIFIILFLKPFDTGEKQLPHKTLMLIGYGLCLIVADLPLLVLERFWVLRKKHRWTLGAELLYQLGFLVLSALLVYVYDLAVTKHTAISWAHFPTYTYQFVLPFALLLLPLLAYLRYSLGALFYPSSMSPERVCLSGQNKGDLLELEVRQLRYIKSEDNYVKVVYYDDTDGLQAVLMRNTLGQMNDQLPSLLYSHRSYLVAPWYIMQLKGNKQKASLTLQDIPEEIPLSSAHFDLIKAFLES